MIIMHAGAAIAFKSCLTATTPTSSTEAEFITAVHAAKLVKCFRYILADLNLTQDKATRMLIDNYAALCMVNEKKPTPRARHLDIQAYAIQDWKDQGDIVMEHLPGILNSSDDLTKG